MKKFMIALTMLLIFANKAMLSSEIEAAKVQEAANAAATLNAINGIVVPATDLSPVISEVQTSEANILSAIDALTAAVNVPATVGPFCSTFPVVVGRYTESLDNTEICDKETGLVWDKQWSGVASLATAQAVCAAKGKSLPTFAESFTLINWSIAIDHVAKDSMLNYWTSLGFDLGAITPGTPSAWLWVSDSANTTLSTQNQSWGFRTDFAFDALMMDALNNQNNHTCVRKVLN
jgi:hypothetical protein